MGISSYLGYRLLLSFGHDSICVVAGDYSVYLYPLWILVVCGLQVSSISNSRPIYHLAS